MQNITDSEEPWDWNFSFPNGAGYYEFYNITYDTLSKRKSIPDISDARSYFLNASGTVTSNSNQGIGLTEIFAQWSSILILVLGCFFYRLFCYSKNSYIKETTTIETT
jgi:hypothetical protein